MTHGEQGGCCGGSGKSDKKEGCCDSKSSSCGASTNKFVTIAAVAVAVGALVYAGSKDGGHSVASKASQSKTDVSTLINGDDIVVAKINGKDVKKSDVARAIRDLGANVTPENVDAILPAFIEQYINLELLNDAADKAGVVKQEEVQTQIASSEEQIVRAAYLRTLFDGKIEEGKLKEAYKAKYEDQPMPMEVKASHILVDDETKARELIARLNAGGNFATLAQENSKDPSAQRGGDLGYFTQADMVKEFGDAAFGMNVGSISQQPVKTQFGWHVIKVEDKRQRAKPSFEEAKPLLEQEARQAILDAKLTELREAAKVEVMPAAQQAAPAAPAAAPAPAGAPAATPAP